MARAGKNNLGASLTVEAALVVPICFYILYIMMYFFMLMRTEFVVYEGLLNVSDRIYAYGAEQAYIENAGISEYILDKVNLGSNDISPEVSQKAKDILANGINIILMKGYLKDYFDNKQMSLRNVNGGVNGIDLSASRVMADSNEVTIIAHYTFNFPVMFGLGKKRASTKLKINTFYGIDWDKTQEFKDNDEEYIYVAETGEVYHFSDRCSYIKLNLKSVSVNEVKTLRSSDGSIYYPCEECGKNVNNGNVFILTYGSRYHTTESCSKIRRNVTRMTKEEAENQGLRACAKCGAKTD